MYRLLVTVLSFSFILLNSQNGNAQDSWKKLSSNAEKLFEAGKFAEAGDNYFQAWKLKPKKNDLAFKAGDCYYMINDYAKASKAYQPVKDLNAEFHHVGFKYARCLKSMQEYDNASREFVYFINSYKGDDYTNMSQLVQNEILGCEYAIKNVDDKGANIQIQHLSENINTSGMEYAPIPYTDDILYFSSDVDGKSKIYRSQKLDGAWTKSRPTDKIFANVTREHYGNVSFAPDNSRFYFTQCDATNSYNSRCDLYLVESEENGKWSDPIILPDYVNDLEATTTHPTVVHDNGIEIIYFSSDRNGGHGGLDLWYVSRDLGSKSLDFTFPKNLGSKINTVGNETTPFYDANAGVLYFSSDGQIGMGGYDIFKSEGKKFDWNKPENIGKPYNSATDDRYYVFQESPDFGFFISNRTSDLSKLSTTDEDIFQFGEFIEELVIKGDLIDDAGQPLSDVNISLYEVPKGGKRKMISNKDYNGSYKFPILEDKVYFVEAKKDDYSSFSLEFQIPSGASSIEKDLVLKKNTGTASSSVAPPTVPTRPGEPTKPTVPETTEKPIVAAIPPSEAESKMEEMPLFEEEEMPLFEEEEAPFEEEVEVVAVEKPVLELPTAVSEPTTISEPVVSTVPSPEPVVHHATEIISEPHTPSVTVPSTPVAVEHSVTTHTTPAPSTSITSTPIVEHSVTTHSGVVSTPTTYPSHSTTEIRSTGNITFDPTPYQENTTSHTSSSNTGSSSGNRSHLTTTSVESGTYYKIQMEAMKYFNKGKYASMQDIGSVESEYIPDRDLVRIMLGNYFNKEDAIAAREEARARGYDRAYVVKYVNGVRKRIKVFVND